MRTAMKKMILFVMIAMLCIGCGKKEAEAVLLDVSARSGESSAPESQEETSQTPEPTQIPEPTETPVIQVICNCRCQGTVSGEGISSQIISPPKEEGKVNINTADAATLQTLNGIGATRAQAIISYRQANGAFQSIEEIKNVEGIKEGVYSKIKDDISIG